MDEGWRWIWLVAAVLFSIGEMFTPGSFFLLPFAIGAVIATVLAFAYVDLAWQWAAFVGVGFGALVAMRPLARRLDTDEPTAGIGSRRLIGQRGVVLEAIGSGELGTVRVDREEWRAETSDGRPMPVGATVRVVDVQGTRVIVAGTELDP